MLGLRFMQKNSECSILVKLERKDEGVNLLPVEATVHPSEFSSV
jgi:hypothetical protein